MTGERHFTDHMASRPGVSPRSARRSRPDGAVVLSARVYTVKAVGAAEWRHRENRVAVAASTERVSGVDTVDDSRTVVAPTVSAWRQCTVARIEGSVRLGGRMESSRQGWAFEVDPAPPGT